MARRRQETVETYSLLDSMLEHTVWFFKVTTIWFFINIACISLAWCTTLVYRNIFGYLCTLVLPYLWCKIRRYRIKDKSKLSFIYLTLVLSVIAQVLYDKGVFSTIIYAVSLIVNPV